MRTLTGWNRSGFAGAAIFNTYRARRAVHGRPAPVVHVALPAADAPERVAGGNLPRGSAS